MHILGQDTEEEVAVAGQDITVEAGQDITVEAGQNITALMGRESSRDSASRSRWPQLRRNR